MTEKVADYEKLLKDLLPRVGESDATLIRASLEKVCTCTAPATLTNTLQDTAPEAEESLVEGGPALSVEERESGDSGAESEASAAAGSTGALDRAEEDFTREEARATGFVGKNSEITWLQRLRQENKYGSPPRDQPVEEKRMTDISSSSFGSKHKPGDIRIPLPEADSGFAVHESSYHLDDLAISTFEAVDAYEVPTPETANQLFSTYVARVHPTFPIVGKVNLTAQFHKFISGHVHRPPEKWLSILNLIFAISAKYSHLIQAEWKGDERDHLIYFTRARMLGLSGETMLQHPELQQIQILGLMAFYLMSISQINR